MLKSLIFITITALFLVSCGPKHIQTTPEMQKINKIRTAFQNVRHIDEVDFGGKEEKLWNCIKNPSVKIFHQNGYHKLAESYRLIAEIDEPRIFVTTFPEPNGMRYAVRMVAMNEEDFRSEMNSFTIGDPISHDPDEGLTKKDLFNRYNNEYKTGYNNTLLLNMQVYCKKNNIVWKGSGESFYNEFWKGIPVLRKALKTVFNKNAEMTPWKMAYITDNFDKLWDENPKFKEKISKLNISKEIEIL